MPPEGALARIRAYSWPGNVRELQNAVERATVLSEGTVLSAEDLLPSSSSFQDGRRESAPTRLTDLPLNYNAAKVAFEKYYIENLLTATPREHS